MTTLLSHPREWIDVEPGPFDKSCFQVSKKMIRLLRHDPSVLRGEDGAVEFRILAQMFRPVFSALVYSSMAELLAKGRRNPLHADTILYFRAIQGH